jgi:hypothetical protein
MKIERGDLSTACGDNALAAMMTACSDGAGSLKFGMTVMAAIFILGGAPRHLTTQDDVDGMKFMSRRRGRSHECSR